MRYWTLAVLLSPVAIAQAPEPRMTLRVKTQLVEVSVVVRDASGSPVTDLKASDFELYDKGKRQEIRLFQVEDHRQAQVVSRPAPSPSPPAAHVFSNRAPVEPDAPNAPTIVVIDAGNTWDRIRMTWQDLVYARDQLVAFLRQVRAEDRLGIYLMGRTSSGSCVNTTGAARIFSNALPPGNRVLARMSGPSSPSTSRTSMPARRRRSITLSSGTPRPT